MKHPQLIVGQPAPTFSTADTFGNLIDLSNHKNKHVLLVFMRYSACPWCNVAIHRLSLEYPLLQKSGCEVVAFIQSTAANISKNIYDQHKVRPGFPIIPDLSQKYYKQYGVSSSLRAVVRSISDIPHWLHSISELGYRQPEIDGNLLLVPAMFLVGPGQQTIIKAEYSASFYDHRTFTEVYEPLTFA